MGFLLIHKHEIHSNVPFDFLPKNLLELLSHEAVDDEVVGAVDDEEPVHEACETEEPCRWPELVAVAVSLADGELGQVDDQPRGVTQQEHDHDADQHRRQIDLVRARAVSIASHVSISVKKQ